MKLEKTHYIIIALIAGLAIGLPVMTFVGYSVGQQSAQPPMMIYSGSTTVKPIMENYSIHYYRSTGTQIIGYDVTGSGHAPQQLAAGVADFGVMSRALKPTEWNGTKYTGYFVNWTIAIDCLSIVIGSGVNATGWMVNGITSGWNTTGFNFTQVQAIYNGTAGKWDNASWGLFGPSQKIVLVGREEGSGTRDYFEEKVLGFAPNYDQLFQTNPGVQGYVSGFTGQYAIGYVGLGFLTGFGNAQGQPNVVPISLDGYPVNHIYPSATAAQDGTYPVARPLFFVTSHSATLPRKASMGENVYSFLTWCLGPIAQEKLLGLGFVPVDQATLNAQFDNLTQSW
ncbi:MAG: PstS family phosphate ABC transporter substrate-binding protein [Candidatus Helarchaeota archaeon]